MKTKTILAAVWFAVLTTSCSKPEPEAVAPAAQAVASAAAPAVAYQVAELPVAEGPLGGPDPMYIADVESAQPVSAADVGYVIEEWLVSGMAAGQPYKTRLQVMRPVDPARFSGQVLVENNHAANRPLVWRYTRDFNISRGHALVAVSTTTADNVQALGEFNPQRYAGLSLVQAQTSDLYAQIGRLLKSDNTPLPGIRALYLTAFSMAAAPLPPYMATHHQQLRLPDGAAIYDGVFFPPSRTASGTGPLPDIDVPVMQMNSQLEVDAIYVAAGINYRKPDSDDISHPYRLYEVAGMPHIESRYTPPGTGQGATHPGIAEPCDNPLNRFPNDRLLSTALDHMIRWTIDNVPPPHAEPIRVVDGAVVIDVHGNAMGGVRHTYVDVPTATHTAANTGPESTNCLVYGSQLSFPAEKLAALYPDRIDYVRQVNSRLDELVAEGWLLEEYAGEFRSEAENFARLPAAL